MLRWTTGMVVGGLLFAMGCRPLLAPADAAEPAGVWMFRNLSWGKQCEGKVTTEEPPPKAAAPRAGPDAGASSLGQQVDACFQGKATPAAAVDCAARAIAGAGIAVRENRTETMSVCEACDCPLHALRLHLLVDPAAQARLEAAGFKVRSRPPPPPEP